MLRWIRSAVARLVGFVLGLLRSFAWGALTEKPTLRGEGKRRQQQHVLGEAVTDAKADFLKVFGDEYGYGESVDELRRKEFARLGERVYVDHAGATLYSEQQLADVFKSLAGGVFGNPHSQHGLLDGGGSAAAEAEARALTLALCNASPADYECVFTSGATGAIKLVAEAFPWSQGSRYVYTVDNHNSVLGVREVAMDGGGTATAVQPVPSSTQGEGGWKFRRRSPDMVRRDPASVASPAPAAAHHLFAYPLESNFSGARLDPALFAAFHCSAGPLQPVPAGSGTHTPPHEAHVTAPGTPPRPSNARGAPPHACENPESLQEDLSGGAQWDLHGERHGEERDLEQRPLLPVQDPCHLDLKREVANGNVTKGEAGDAAVSQGSAGARSLGLCLGGSAEWGEERRRHVSGGELGARREGGGEAEELVEAGGAGRWWLLLDAAKACCTAPPDLSTHPADFVALSFYKIFGYPTGLGALLVRKEVLPHLRKSYFGGGTVAVSVAATKFFRRRQGAAGLEDGTAAYLALAALPRGFAQIESVGGFSAIHRHTSALTRYMVGAMMKLRHDNGKPVCVVYGAHEGLAESHAAAGSQSTSGGAVGQGPVVTFNLLRSDSSFVGYREVEKLAMLSGIMLRTGCFCNPGACAHHLGLSPAQLEANYQAGHVCWDERDILNGQPTGAVRVSFGYMSTFEDAHAVLQFIREYFQQRGPAPLMSGRPPQASMRQPGAVLEEIWVYPIKSCGGFSPREWPMTSSGLLWDREWLLVDESGRTLTQKRHPQLATVRARVDLSAGVVQVSAPGMSEALLIPLPRTADLDAQPQGGATASGRDTPSSGNVVQTLVRVCGDDVCGLEVMEAGATVLMKEWWRQVLGVPCRVVRRQTGTRTAVMRPPLLQPSSESASTADSHEHGPELSFANEGQLLLLNTASLEDLNGRLQEGGSPPVTSDRFRPNLVVGGAQLYAFEEDTWTCVAVGDCQFDSAGPCARCEMVTLDQSTGARGGVEPLRTLASFRRHKGRIFFGALLNSRQSPARVSGHVTLHLGDRILPG